MCVCVCVRACVRACVRVCVCAGTGSSVTLEVCNTETFNPTCPRNEVIIVERALYGRLQLGQRTRRHGVDRHLYTLLAVQTAAPPIILKVAVARWRTARVIISLTCQPITAKQIVGDSQ